MARDRKKTLKKEKVQRKTRKSQTITIIFFLFLVFYVEKKLFCYKTYLGKLYIFKKFLFLHL